MKQFTTYGQTAHLVALGFPTPKSVSKLTLDLDLYTIPTFNYSIGELIEILDSVNETVHCRFGGVKANLISTNSGYEKIGGELIDLLFDLCVKLKEEGVI